MPGFFNIWKLVWYISLHQIEQKQYKSLDVEKAFDKNQYPESGAFQMSQFFTSGGQSTGVSASIWVLPMSIQDWFSLRWTGWISLQSKWLSRVSGKDGRQEEKGMTEGEMVGWHHQLKGHECE